MHGRVEPKVPDANANGMDVDWGDVDASFRQLQASNWYQKAKNSLGCFFFYLFSTIFFFFEFFYFLFSMIFLVIAAL